MRSRRLAWLAPAIGLLFAACSSASPAPPRRPVEPPAAPVEEPHWTGGLPRPVVDDALKAGLGRFLAHVEVEAKLEKGKFVGWTVLALKPPQAWEGVGLQIGDVVTQVNGFPFRSLAVASEIRVSYLREGKPDELRIEILDGDAATAAVAATPAPSTTSSATTPAPAPAPTPATTTIPTSPKKK
jgi:hypothetical protein